MRVPHNKLVRDRIPEIIQAEELSVTHVLDDTSYRAVLLAKLVEEAQEAGHATAAELPGELADVLEVLQALTAMAGMSWSQLLALAPPFDYAPYSTQWVSDPNISGPFRTSIHARVGLPRWCMAPR